MVLLKGTECLVWTKPFLGKAVKFVVFCPKSSLCMWVVGGAIVRGKVVFFTVVM